MKLCYMLLVLLKVFKLIQCHISNPKIILVDAFTQYLSGHVREYCEDNDIEIYDILSPYLYGLLTSQGKQLPDNFISPDPGEEIIWAITNGILNEDYTPESLNNIMIFSESDAGIGTAERIQQSIGLRGNNLSPHIRNKYLLNERARERGLNVVKQALVRSIDDIEKFVTSELNWPPKELNKPPNDDKDNNKSITSHTCISSCVIKPYIGVASDGVYKCSNYNEIHTAFTNLYNKPKYGGGLNDALLIQECITGTEYAVDTVTKNGITKIIALWKYKKYSLNHAPFVYQCSELVASSSSEAKEVCQYCINLLEALEYKWGPTHTGPRVIEVNGRWHAQHFYPIVMKALHYDALSATIDAAFFPEKFDALPIFPDHLLEEGVIIHLISTQSGPISSTNHIDTIKQLPSVIDIWLGYEKGDILQHTIDIRTDCGYVLLCHPNRTQVEVDYETIVKLQSTLFTIADLPTDASSVIVEDTSSTTTTTTTTTIKSSDIDLNAFYSKVANDFKWKH